MLSREQRIGLFFLTGLVLLVVTVELTLGLGVLHDRSTYYADFRDVQGLDRGADVRLAGLRAGRVTDMAIVGDHVRVTLSVDRALPVKTDALARLDFRALSGERFVSLDLGSPTAPRATSGAVLQGETPAGLADAVDRLAGVAQSIQQLADRLNQDGGRLLATLSQVVGENQDALGTLAQRLASVSEKLDRGTGTLGLLLNDPTLYDRATAALGQVHDAAHELAGVASTLQGGDGTLSRLLTDEALASQVQDTVDGLAVAARNAQEITDDLRAGRGTLGKVLVDDQLHDTALDTLQTTNRAAQSLEDQAPLSILGTIVTSLF
jgi:phospholipid/cholesterol/gamma-HCH transport system substrate-binding protein